MASTHQFFRQLNEVREALDAPELEPDSQRDDWARHRARLGELRSRIDGLHRDLDASAAGGEAEERLRMERALSEVTSELAAAIEASGDRAAAVAALAAAAELAPASEQELLRAAERDPQSFALFVRAMWRKRRTRGTGVPKILKQVVASTKEPSLRRAAQRLLRNPRPVTSAPPLFRINGCGVGLYGASDPDNDGSHVATYCLSFLFIPIFPLLAYRVRRQDNSYWFIARETLGPVAGALRSLLLAGLVGLIGYAAISSYLHSPSRRAGLAFAHAQKTEKAGQTEAAIGEYERLAKDFQYSAGGEVVDNAVEAVVRLGATAIKEPFTPDQVDAASRMVLRFQALPSGVQRGAAARSLVDKMGRWADQLGDKPYERAEAALRLLDAVSTVAGGDGPEVAARRLKLRKAMATELAPDWPVAALAYFMEMGTDGGALDGAGKVIASMNGKPSLLLDGRADVEAWLAAAAGQPALKALMEETRARLDGAIQMIDGASRRRALELGDKKALASLVQKRPEDQELVTSLATAERGEGQVAAAMARLVALGSPGWTTGAAQLLRGMLYADAGRLEEADRLLGRFVTVRLGRFQRAAHELEEASRTAQEALVASARAGHLPSAVSSKMEGATDDQQREMFLEWMKNQMTADPKLTALRNAYLRNSEVVPAALALGRVKLERSKKAAGAARRLLLDEAERLFLAIRQEAEGQPSFHLGLGQVYYRLGKDAEGDHEFKALLESGEARQKMMVAQAYRDLGVIARAREISQQVYASGDKDLKSEAAVLLSLMSSGLEERERWLKLADKTPFVEQNLRELEAEKLYRDGQYGEADALYAKVVEGYEKDAARDNAAANNAALAEEQRYICTGDGARLGKAVKLLEGALKLSPDIAMINGNLAQMLAYQAMSHMVDRFVGGKLLRADPSEADDLVDGLLEGPEREHVMAALREDGAYHRSVELSRQEEVLAPQNTSGYERQRELYSRLYDLDAERALASRVESQTSLDTTRSDESWKKWKDGSDDERLKADLDLAVVRAERRVVEVEKSKSPPAIAAAERLRAVVRLRRLMAFGAPEDAREGVAAYRRAAEVWRPIGARSSLGWALFTQAVLEAAAKSPPLDEEWRRSRRDGVVTQMQHLLASPHKDEMLTALRRQPQLAEAATLVREELHERPGIGDWLLGQVAGDAKLIEATQAALTRPQVAVAARIRVKLNPLREDAKTILELLAKTAK